MSVAHSHRLAFDGTVLECVLLAIIEAHTTPATDGDQHRRLNAAMDALTGDPKASKQDEANAKAFEWMARERQRDACNHEMSVLLAGPNEAKRPRRSVRELAIRAAHEFLNCLNDDELLAATDMLCGKISGSRYVVSLDFDPAREAMQADAVQRICSELAEWGIPTQL